MTSVIGMMPVAAVVEDVTGRWTGGGGGGGRFAGYERGEGVGGSQEVRGGRENTLSRLLGWDEALECVRLCLLDSFCFFKNWKSGRSGWSFVSSHFPVPAFVGFFDSVETVDLKRA